MGRSYPIWVDVRACIYNSSKSYGAKNVNEQSILVGSSASNSHTLVNIATKRSVGYSDKHGFRTVWFRFYVDDVLMKHVVFRADANDRAMGDPIEKGYLSVPEGLSDRSDVNPNHNQRK